MLNHFDAFEDVLEHLDITPERVLEILYEGGHIDLPPWLELPEIHMNEDGEIELGS